MSEVKHLIFKPIKNRVQTKTNKIVNKERSMKNKVTKRRRARKLARKNKR